ncbi:MAG: Ig-like domain-containing protein [Roseburia sp.]|nr:Ig-like domain-containing protein [Roseburia sp.]
MKGLFKNSMALLLAGAMVLSDAGISTMASQISPEAQAASEFTESTETETVTDNDQNTEAVSTETPEEEPTETGAETAENTETTGEDPTLDADTETDTTISDTEIISTEETSEESTEELLEEETEEKMEAPEGYTDVTNTTEWVKSAFGQSTDLNFESTILPNKIGTQTAEKTKIKVGETEKDALIMESRGGKIANAHDGMMYYYTKLPVDTEFVLTAKVFINQLGPENGSTPSKQEAVGLMVRDTISASRQDPLLEGYEELPACSNVVGTLIQSNDKAAEAKLNAVAYHRNGIFSATGNANSEYKANAFQKTITERGAGAKNSNNADLKTVTKDITKTEYAEGDFFTLELKKTNEGFTCTYTSADGKTTKSATYDDPGRLKVVDKDNMYVGLLASRNAKVTYTDIALYTKTGTTCPDPTFVSKGFAAAMTDYSNAYTDSTDYNLVLRPSYDGTITVTSGGSQVASIDVKEGEDTKIPVTLSGESTTFESTFTKTADKTEAKATTTVAMTPEKYRNKDLYVSADGTATAEGTEKSPLDIETALNYVSAGYTVYVAEGTYKALNIPASVSAYSADARKTLRANGNVIFSGNSYLNANYWVLDGVKITGSDSAGLRVNGTGNILQNCEFYENQDTGCQLGLGSGTARGLWPRDNVVQYCYSHNNVDASGINADGYAAKLGVGTGNVFRYCESANNADDGWDLFNKLGDIKNDPITIEYCIAHGNGNNGFKLGGEGYDVDHKISYCVAYHNNLDGFTCNFNTGAITATNNTSFDNKRYNYIFRFNPYLDASKAGTFKNNISFRSDSFSPTLNASGKAYNDYIYSTDKTNNFFYTDGNAGITAADFVNITPPEADKFNRNLNGTFIMNGFLRPVVGSALATANDNFVGAVSPSDDETNSITLDKKKLTIKKIGSTTTLKATVTPENPIYPVIWSSSNEKVATVEDGVVKAVKNGTATITVSCGEYSANCEVKVSQKVDSVSITLKDQTLSGTVTVQKGKSYTLKAVVKPSNADKVNAKVTWSTSDKKIATVNSKGKVTFKKTGKVTITAKTADGKKKSVKFKAQSKAVKVTKVKVSGKATMKVKKKQTLKATVLPATAGNQKVTWKSSNKKIATVSSKGVVTAKKKGTVKITATAKDGSKKKSTFKIKVTK